MVKEQRWAFAAAKSSDHRGIVWPLCDSREHEIKDGAECWCKPELICGLLFHSALDGRDGVGKSLNIRWPDE